MCMRMYIIQVHQFRRRVRFFNSRFLFSPLLTSPLLIACASVFVEHGARVLVSESIAFRIIRMNNNVTSASTGTGTGTGLGTPHHRTYSHFIQTPRRAAAAGMKNRKTKKKKKTANTNPNIELRDKTND